MMTLRYHNSTHALIPFILLLLLLSQPSSSALDVPQPLIQCENTTIRDHSQAAKEHSKWNLQVYFEGDVWWSELVPCHGEECEWRIDYPANSTIGFCSDLTGECPDDFDVLPSNSSSPDGEGDGVGRSAEEVDAGEEREELWDDGDEQDCIGCNSGANSSYILQRWHEMLSHTSSEPVTSEATSGLTSASSRSTKVLPSSPSSQSSIQQPSSSPHASSVASTTAPSSTSSHLPGASQSSATSLLISPSQTAHILSTTTSTPSAPPQTSTSSTSSPHTAVLVGSILGGVSGLLLLFSLLYLYRNRRGWDSRRAEWEGFLIQRGAGAGAVGGGGVKRGRGYAEMKRGMDEGEKTSFKGRGWADPILPPFVPPVTVPATMGKASPVPPHGLGGGRDAWAHFDPATHEDDAVEAGAALSGEEEADQHPRSLDAVIASHPPSQPTRQSPNMRRSSSSYYYIPPPSSLERQHQDREDPPPSATTYNSHATDSNAPLLPPSPSRTANSERPRTRRENSTDLRSDAPLLQRQSHVRRQSSGGTIPRRASARRGALYSAA